MNNRTSMAYLFLAPFLILYTVIIVYPLFKGFYISLHNWDLVGFTKEFIGLKNYREMFADEMFGKVLYNTLKFVVFGVTLMTSLSLGLALALNRQGRYFSIVRTIFFCSGVLSVTVIAIIWQKVLTPNSGLIANILEGFGFEAIPFTGSINWSAASIIIATLWWGVGFPVMLFLAGLQQIPHELYEAALIDNAGPWKRFKSITLPSLSRTMIFVVLTQTVGHFQFFGQVQLLTAGGPANSTRTIVQYIYETGWRDWSLGYASSMSMILFVIMALVSFLQFKVQK